MRFSWLAVLCLLISATAVARPYTVEDLLKLESYGQVVVDPTQRWAVVERRGPYASARRYSYGFFNNRQTSRLLLVSLTTDAAPEALLPSNGETGYWIGGFSPTGKRLSVFRLQDDRLSLGSLDMETRRTTWFALAPDLLSSHPAPLWIDDERLVFVTRADGQLPAMLRYPTVPQRSLPTLWAEAAMGAVPSVRAVGTGRFINEGIGGNARHMAIADARTGAISTFFSGEVTDVALSGDRKHVAIAVAAEAVQPLAGEAVTPGFQPRRRRLKIVDLATRAVLRPCDGCDLAPDLLSWSSKGSKLLFYARQDGGTWQDGELHVFEAGTAGTEAITSGLIDVEVRLELGSSLVVEADWRGDTPAVYGRKDGEAAAAWHVVSTGRAARFTEPGSSLVGLSETGHAFLEGGRLWSIGRGNRKRHVASGVESTSPELLDPYSVGSRRYFNERPKRLTFYTRAGPSGARELILMGGDGPQRPVRIPRAAKVVASTAQGSALLYVAGVSGVGELIRIRSNGSPQIVDRINQHLNEVELPEAIPVQSTSSTGDKLHHWLLLPQPPEGGGALPSLVVVPYPGQVHSPEAQPRPLRSDFVPDANHHLLVGLGYAVLVPSIPLPAGTTDTISTVSERIKEAVDAAKMTGRISNARPALYGHSFGGYAALGTASVQDGFSAIVAAGAPTDLAAFYGSFLLQSDISESGLSLVMSAGWFESGQGGLGGPPWTEPERYRLNSPFYRGRNISAPVLLIHGELDYVPVSQAERMLSALHRTGESALLLRYAGEGHVFSSPANIRHQWQAIDGFLRSAQREALP